MAKLSKQRKSAKCAEGRGDMKELEQKMAKEIWHYAQGDCEYTVDPTKDECIGLAKAAYKVSGAEYIPALVEALKMISFAGLSDELDEEQLEVACFETGYNELVKWARQALDALPEELRGE